MDTFEKHKTAWKVVIIVAGLALILASFLPYLALIKSIITKGNFTYTSLSGLLNTIVNYDSLYSGFTR